MFRGFLHVAQAAIVVAAMSFGTGQAARAASFTRLGDLPGIPRGSSVGGVSADGSVILGGASSSVFRWSANDGATWLGSVPTPFGAYPVGSQASASDTGISADGSTIVGFGSIQYAFNLYGYEAFRWQAGNVIGLATSPPNRLFDFSFASGVSADGSVVVGRGSNGGGHFGQAFRWTERDGMIGLGDLPGSTFINSSATGVSADGAVVVGDTSSSEAFRWTANSGMVGLGNLLGGNSGSRASGVSADGSAVIGLSLGANGNEAFRWTANGGMAGLGDLAGGDFYSYANGVSSDGSVIVGYSSSTNGYEPFIWNQDRGMQSLADVLTASGIDLTGWKIDSAAGISADGLTIYGSGHDASGNYEGWLAKLDAPQSIAAVPTPALLPGLISFGLGLWRKRRTEAA
jgi:probable HAF family extracellular repeat protein